MSAWAKFVGVDRTTIMRHKSGIIDPIPSIYLKALEWLERGELKNPNITED